MPDPGSCPGQAVVRHTEADARRLDCCSCRNDGWLHSIVICSKIGSVSVCKCLPVSSPAARSEGGRHVEQIPLTPPLPKGEARSAGGFLRQESPPRKEHSKVIHHPKIGNVEIWPEKGELEGPCCRVYAAHDAARNLRGVRAGRALASGPHGPCLPSHTRQQQERYRQRTRTAQVIVWIGHSIESSLRHVGKMRQEEDATVETHQDRGLSIY